MGEEPLLRSKLVIPAPPDALVERPRLGKMLTDGARGPVTLLAAPAGWGKTALLSWWAHGDAHGGPVAWLSLEPGDEGPRFWSYLRAALETAAVDTPAVDTRALDTRAVDTVAMDTPAVDSPALGTTATDDHAYLARLADALVRVPEPVVVILDDLHHVRDGRILTGLEFLLRHAGTRLRLILATRVEPPLPLHRWRLSGELTELRNDDLSFTAEETVELLARHDLPVSAAHASELHARTEGWPAGLRFAALANPAEASELSGEDQVIADYLAEEVLAAQPPEIRDVLLGTSILEHISGGLVDALTGRTDGEQILAELDRTNAFVVPLGTGPWSCRYHRMFGELLRAQLRRESPERIPELHRRAARWHATHDLPMDAIRHALAAHDWRYATGVVVAHWHDLALYGHDETPPTGSTPPPADAVRADPELALAYAADRLDLHDLGSADRYLRLADRHGHLLAEDRRGRFEVMTAAFHLAEAQRSGDAARVLSAAPHMLALADRADEEGARSIALTALGTAQLTVGEVAPAEATLSDGLAAAERAGLSCPRLVCTSALANIRAGRGELQSAESTARTALDLPACPGQAHAVHRAHAYLALALVDLHRDRLGDAGPNLDLAARSCDATAEPALAASIALARAQLRHEEGDLAGSYEALLAGRRSLGDWRPPRCLEHWFAAMEADLRTSHGETDSSREVLAPLLADPSPQVVVALARAYLRDGDSEGALKALPDWAGDDALPLPIRLEAGLVEASAARLGVDGRRASKALERVLQLAEPEGFRRIFTRAGGSVRELLADHLDTGTAYWSLVSDLTAASSARPTSGNGHRAVPATTPLTDPLTDRELTVLRYLQSILSNVEIASELCLSVNTVKTHVRNIYRKLDATRRRDAVRRARELRLI